MIQSLLTKHRNNNIQKDTDSKLLFELEDQYQDYDVYNISAAFNYQDERYLLARVEKRDSESSHTILFQSEDDKNWKQVKYLFPLQDPFFTIIDNELIIGGVEFTPDERPANTPAYRTVFYRGTSFDALERFATGPWGMKDLRLKGLQDGSILLLTRPQGEKGGRGRIGSTILHSLEELTVERINDTPLLSMEIPEDLWVGGNEVHELQNNRLGILSHIACFDEEGNRHYYASTFVMDANGENISDVEIIAERRDFADGDFKRPDLVDVIFSGGLERLANGKAKIYCGVSDAEAHARVIEDPFCNFE